MSAPARALSQPLPQGKREDGSARPDIPVLRGLGVGARLGGSLRKLALALLGGIVLAAGACALLLPERFAVNAPLAHMLWGQGVGAPSEAEIGSRIRAAQGFSITLFAAELPGPRFLRPLPDGSLLVSLPKAGRIERLEPDRDGDGRSDDRSVVLADLNRAQGMDVSGGWLYVGETDAVGRIRFDPSTGRTEGAYDRLVTGLPAGGNHWTRTLRFGPDGLLYVSIGSSCNACEEDDPRRATIMRYRPDGSGGEIFASGLRNAVGFDWHPASGALFATDNGRDLLGDDFPPCELNLVVEGGFYGWPHANGANVPDPDFGEADPGLLARATPPAHPFGAHNAPLGITFVRSPDAPAALRGAALVALHGSWNRTEKDGYKVVSLHWRPDGSIEERDFVVGFELDEDVIGRPVDVAQGADGAFYISDDYAGAVYRVHADAAGTGTAAPSPAPATETTDEAQPPGDPTRGRSLYEANACAGCHEPERAAPGFVPVPLTSLSARYTIDSLASFLATPTPPMPVAPLDAAKRRDLATFLLSEHP